ncbi:nucleotidyltransferase family protein [Segetibacter koreensis]|uniref:nucleotidyltransferase family protein n=1 Tax=Segetibacter koreensis TaxID=398037 RepID=UPI0003812E61|nr:nucleotidyltransferase family protein [Segetibacter koreensis]
MVIKEAIILAGGLGTRLRSAVPDLPKCMAPINEKPFLTYVINHLKTEGITHFIFALGYKSEVVEAYLEKDFPTLLFKTSVEEEPLGTGGAVKKALALAKENSVIIANGDTLYNIDAELLASIHSLSGACCTLSLKPMKNFDRYGVVEIDECSLIKSFKEKQFYESGLINGGVYAIHRHKFLEENLPEKFSFEKDYLEVFYKKRRMFGVVQDEYFIDIGVPEDYERAQRELKYSPQTWS